MSDRSAIEWTDATWSPVTGCTKVSDGCLHCYIERTPPFRMAGRRFKGPAIGASTGADPGGRRVTAAGARGAWIARQGERDAALPEERAG